jgi:hypothetical protein
VETVPSVDARPLVLIMPEPGQACSDCHGMGKKLESYMAIGPDGKTFTDYRAEYCGTCQGTGWLPGRSQ